MAEAAVKVTKEMLGDMEKAGLPEEASYMTFDLGSLAAYADIDFDWKAAKYVTIYLPYFSTLEVQVSSLYLVSSLVGTNLILLKPLKTAHST